MKELNWNQFIYLLEFKGYMFVNHGVSLHNGCQSGDELVYGSFVCPL